MIDSKLLSLLDKYKLTMKEKEELLNIINYIYIHDEFQRRMTTEFLHHDTITLGQHIIEVTIMTYILSKKYNQKKEFNLETALKISMFHDLYTLPWQNNPNAKVDNFINKHGFRHPIESIINANIWYRENFNNKTESKKIIDGIVHHMYPLPVRAFSEDCDNTLELKNYEYVKELSEENKSILVTSSNRFKIGELSICPSIYLEGRVVSNADKLVSLTNFQGSDIESIKALVTGKNKKLERKIK